MRYEVDYDPDDNTRIVINLDARLLEGNFLHIDPTDDAEDVMEKIRKEAVNPEGMAAFYSLIIEIPGMRSEFIFERYCIYLNKAKLFSWKQLLPVILTALQCCLAPDGIIVDEEKQTSGSKKKLKSVELEGTKKT